MISSFRVLTVATLFFGQAIGPYVGAFAFATTSQQPGGIPNAKGTIEINSPVNIKKVAVTGATGRTGRLVVEKLLKKNIEVVAVVRDVEKADQMFSKPPFTDLSKLSVTKCNLGSEKDIGEAIEGCDAAIWCATGFSNAPDASLLQKIQKFIGLALPKQSIDIVGVPALARILSDKVGRRGSYPKLVMLSSAGVTRPSWNDDKKSLFPGAADIPIVRLNPFGILDIKKESEDKLRETGTDYCIVRACGLNDDWPPNARPIFSQGDVAVGRINREDVASVLVNSLLSPEAIGKTFEVVTLKGYLPAPSIEPALSCLVPDSEGIPTNEKLMLSYSMMQQLLPGETQDSAGLAMGQTYEQLDEGVTGRLGKRGEEDAENAAPKPSS